MTGNSAPPPCTLKPQPFGKCALNIITTPCLPSERILDRSRDYLNDLNEEQRDAVTHGDSDKLVRSGPLPVLRDCKTLRRQFSATNAPCASRLQVTAPVMRPGAIAQGREPVAVIENTIWKQRTTD